ncbi:MAG TPA: hypothetical protein VER55_08030, partial [Ardenticatenaceae bacterium]|nr:hypothetical protein [Ardenticatenaceae bacterium]
TEWWYLDRLGLVDREAALPEGLPERLAFVRARFEEVLPGLDGDATVVTVDGESWSARKLLRRALFHERDHTQHLRALLGAYLAATLLPSAEA